MLEIIINIFTFLGFSLLTILSIILLVVTILIFTPLKYIVDVNNTNQDLVAKVNITFLLKIIKFDFIYTKSNSDPTNINLRIFNKPIDLQGKNKENSNPTTTSQTATVVREKDSPSNHDNHADTNTDTVIKEDLDNIKDIDTKDINTKNNDTTILNNNSLSNDLQPNYRRVNINLDNDFEKDLTKKIDITNVFNKNINTVIKKFKKIKSKIKSFFKKSKTKYKKSKKLYAKFQNFINLESRKLAFSKIKKSFKIMLKKVNPNTLKFISTIGLEDPANTGVLIAFLGFIETKFSTAKINITGDFNGANTLKDTEIYISGKLKAIYFINLILSTLINKDVRNVIKFFINDTSKNNKPSQSQNPSTSSNIS